MNTVWRTAKGTALGAIMTATVAVAATALLSGTQIIVFDLQAPIDRARDLSHLGRVLLIAVSAGLIVGAIGGFVAKLPQRGVGMLTSISIVAGCAAIARLPLAIQPRYLGAVEPSYIPSILAALVGGALVFVYAIAVKQPRDKRVLTTDAKKQNNPPKTEVK
jgi:hypothetical protein